MENDIDTNETSAPVEPETGESAETTESVETVEPITEVVSTETEQPTAEVEPVVETVVEPETIIEPIAETSIEAESEESTESVLIIRTVSDGFVLLKADLSTSLINSIDTDPDVRGLGIGYLVHNIKQALL